MAVQEGFLFREEIGHLGEDFQEATGLDPKAWAQEGFERVFVNEAFLQSGIELSATEDVRRLGFYEWIEKSSLGWEPKSVLFDTIRDIVQVYAPNLDVNSSVYITGRNSLSRGLLSVFARIGFSKLNWVVLPEELEDPVTTACSQDILRYHFSLKLQVMDVFELGSRHRDGSVLVNTVSSIDTGSPFEDVLFFNFLHPQAVCLDFGSTRTLESRMFQELKKENMRAVSRTQLGDAWLQRYGDTK